MPFLFYFFIVLVLAAPFINTFVTFRICRKTAIEPDNEPQFAGKAPRRTYFYPARAVDGDGSYSLPPSYSACGHDQENAEHGAKGDERH